MLKTQDGLAVIWGDPWLLNESRMKQSPMSAGLEVQACLFACSSRLEPKDSQEKRWRPCPLSSEPLSCTMLTGWVAKGDKRGSLREKSSGLHAGPAGQCLGDWQTAQRHTFIAIVSPGSKSEGWEHAGLAGFQPQRLQLFLIGTWHSSMVKHISQIKMSSDPTVTAFIRNMWKKKKGNGWMNEWMKGWMNEGSFFLQSSRENYRVNLSIQNQAFFFFKGKVTSFSFCVFIVALFVFCEIKLGHICLAVLLIKPQLEWGLCFAYAMNQLAVLSLTVSSCLGEKNCVSNLHVRRQSLSALL